MHFMRKASLTLIAGLFSLSLLLLVLAAGLGRIVQNPDVIKESLHESGVYDSVVKGTLEQVAKQSENPEEQSPEDDTAVSFSQPEVIAAAENAFSPELLQTSTENFIDGIHKWLEGDTELPQFMIDLTAAKEAFADNVANAMRERVAALPACTSADQVPNENLNPFDATCVPPGFDVESEIAKLEQEINGNEEFLEDPTLDASSIEDKESGQSVFATDLKEAPKAYQAIKTAPIVFGVIALLTGAVIVFLSDTKRKGLRRVAVILATTGGLLLLGAWLARLAFERLGQATTSNDIAQALKDSVVFVVTRLGREISSTYIAYAGAFILLSIGIAAGLYFTREKTPKHKTENPSKTTDASGIPETSSSNHEIKSSAEEESKDKK